MPQSCRLKCQLEKVRKLSEEMLTSFSSPDEWVHQVHSKANHALWFMGHMAMTDNYLLSVVAPEKQRDLPGYAERFGMGSVPVSDADSYPRPEDVLATMRERRQALLEVLDGMDDDSLTAPFVERTSEMFDDPASVFELAAWHESLHAGQVSVARRSLGYEPIFDAE